MVLSMNDTCSPPSHNNHPPPAPLCPNITYRFSGLISFHFLTNQLREFKNLMIKVFLIWWSCHSQIFSLKTFVMVPLTCKSCKKKLVFSFSWTQTKKLSCKWDNEIVPVSELSWESKTILWEPKGMGEKFWAANYNNFLQYSQRF